MRVNGMRVAAVWSVGKRAAVPGPGHRRSAQYHDIVPSALELYEYGSSRLALQLAFTIPPSAGDLRGARHCHPHSRYLHAPSARSQQSQSMRLQQ